MQVRVLGSSAGGGLPQWNCGCANCARARAGGIAARTQDSVAVSADGQRWVLLNVSPDVRQQLAAFPALHPRGLRGSPIEALVLTSADVDHCLGLFVLREGSPLAIHGTAAVLDSLRSHDALCRTLERTPDQTRWVPLEPGHAQAVLGASGEPTGLVIEAIPVPGKLPPHLVDLVAPGPAHNVGVIVRAAGGGAALGYAPCVAHDTPLVQRIVREADVLLFDGTFWSNDELVSLGAAHRRADEMAHWPLSAEGGSLAMLRRSTRAHTVLTHINNTNPILAQGPEQAEVRAAGIVIAHDGLVVSS